MEAFRARLRRRWTLPLAAAAAVGTGCSSDTPTQAEEPDPPTAHVQVNEMMLEASGSEVLLTATRMIDEVWVPDTLVVAVGDSLPVQVVFLDFSNAEFTLDDATDHSVRAEVEGPASWVQRGAHGTIHADAPGEARVRFQVWHIDHPDFTSPWLTVSVVDRTP